MRTIIPEVTQTPRRKTLHSVAGLPLAVTKTCNISYDNKYFPNSGLWDKTNPVNLSKLYLETIHKRKIGFQSCGNGWQESYKEFHEKTLESPGTGRYLIYSCKGEGFGCAGYGNRIGGIASLFFLAVLTNRVFLIDWKKPESLALERFFRPKEIKWNYDLSELESLPSTTHYWGKGFPKNHQLGNIVKPGNDYGQFAKWFQSINFDEYFDKPVERITATWSFGHEIWSNPYFIRKAHKLGLERPLLNYSLVGCSFNFLFKTTPELQSKISQTRTMLFANYSAPVIGLHIRMGDAVFGRRRPLNIQNFRSFFSCARLVEKSIVKSNRNIDVDSIRWFLATDDILIKRYAVEQFPGKILTLDLQPQHIGIFQKVRFPSYEGMIGVLLDHIMLADCFFIILSSSTFGTTALGLRYHAMQSFTFGDTCGIVDNKIKTSTSP